MFADKKVQPSPGLIQYWSKLGDQWNSMGRTQEASNYYQKALEMSQKVFGPSHRTTKNLADQVGSFSQL